MPKAIPAIVIAAPINGCSSSRDAAAALVKNRRYKLVAGGLIFIERGERHEIRNSGRTLLRTLNFCVPPAYGKRGRELPRGKR